MAKKRLVDAMQIVTRLSKRISVLILLGAKASEVYDEVLKVIAEAPTEEAVEVVHGRWVVRVEFNNGERVIAACSNCNVQGEVRTHRNEWGIWQIHSPYCPNCGAKMDGGASG